jgi:hypothetical protein
MRPGWYDGNRRLDYQYHPRPVFIRHEAKYFKDDEAVGQVNGLNQNLQN